MSERQIIYPVRIVTTGGNIENVPALLEHKVPQIGLNESNFTVFKGKSYVIFDFGEELSGSIRVLTYRVSGNGKVRLRFGESVTETCAEIGEKNAGNDHSTRDFTAELQNFSDMTFGNSGFRFFRLDVLGEEASLSIKSVLAVSDADAKEILGKFECDDPLINKIWDTAEHTLRLCLHNGFFWDGVKRDRLVWIGDLYPETRAAFCLYGDPPETRNSLKFVYDETPLPGWMNNFPTYSLWWLIILYTEYMHSGDKNRVIEYLPYIDGLLRQISDNVTEEGETTFSLNFIDWPTHYQDGDEEIKREEELIGVHYLTRLAMRDTKELLLEMGKDASFCEEILKRLDKKTYEVKKFKQIAALGVWAGNLSEQNKKVLLKGGAKGLSTFMSYPILSAIAEYGEYGQALSIMKEYYGGMLGMGATSFWEDFDIEWTKNAFRIDELPVAGKTDIHGDFGAFCYVGFRHSFCHGWASGVIPYLTETVLGVQPQGAGLRRIKISPHIDGLKHVKGIYPTPYGNVTVEHVAGEDGKVKTTVSAPPEVEIITD